MTAQQQLAFLLRLGPEYGQRNDGTDAVEFLRDHGPAIAEQCKEHDDWAATLGQLVVALMQDDLALAKDIARGIRLEFTTDGSPRAESAALRKLTQEATP